MAKAKAAAQPFAKTLEMFAAFLEGAGASRSAYDLAALAGVLGEVTGKPFTDRITRVKKYWQVVGWAGGHPPSLKTTVERIASVLQAAGAATAASQCNAVLTLFQGAGTLDTTTFLAEVQGAIETPLPTKKPAEKKPSSSKKQKEEKPPKVTLDHRAIQDYASKLTTAITNQTQFKAIIAELRSLNGPTKAQYEAVSAQFFGYKRKFTKISDIFNDMETHQLQESFEAARKRSIAKIAV